MATSKATVTRKPTLRVVAYVTIALATVLGLFAMHGAPMTMPTSTSHASGSPIVVSMTMNPASVESQASLGLPEHARAAVAGDALTPGMRTSGTHGRCDAAHDDCVATLRAQNQLTTPAGVALPCTHASSAAQSLCAHHGRRFIRVQTVRPPCLHELCISRT